MRTQIKNVGLANGIRYTGKTFTLSEMIQESYVASYEAKKSKNSLLIKLTETHLMNVKNSSGDLTNLSEDLDVLKSLIVLSKKARLVEGRSSSNNSGANKELSWKSSRKSLNEGLKNFRSSARSKIFYKELDKFNKNIASGKPVTILEATNLYKAANSCLTHLTVEFERQPEFLNTYKVCTKLLASDNNKLLEAIQSGKVPSRSLLERFVAFTNILLESDTPEDLDPEIYDENVNLPKIDDENVLNEDDDMLALDDKNVLNEDDDMLALDDEGVDGDEPLSEDVAVDLTPEEIKVLKSILGKISSMDEGSETGSPDDDVLPDETVVPEIDDAETPEDPAVDPLTEDGEDPTIDSDEITSQTYNDDEENLNPQGVDGEDPVSDDAIDENGDPEDTVPTVDEPGNTVDDDEPVSESGDNADSDEIEMLRNKLSDIRNSIDEVIDNDPDNAAEDPSNPQDDLDVEISEAATTRIRNCCSRI